MQKWKMGGKAQPKAVDRFPVCVGFGCREKDKKNRQTLGAPKLEKRKCVVRAGVPSGAPFRDWFSH